MAYTLAIITTMCAYTLGTCGGQRPTSDVFLNHVLPYCFKMGLGLTDSARWAGQGVPATHSSPPCSAGLTDRQARLGGTGLFSQYLRHRITSLRPVCAMWQDPTKEGGDSEEREGEGRRKGWREDGRKTYIVQLSIRKAWKQQEKHWTSSDLQGEEKINNWFPSAYCSTE